MSQSLKTLLIGAGYAGGRFLRVLSYLESTEPDWIRFAGVVDTDPAKLADIPQHLPCFSDLDTALDAVQPDIAVICVNEYMHYPVLSRLCRSSARLILTEKPLTSTLDEAKSVAEQLGPRTISMNLVERFSPIVAAARTWLADRTQISIRRVEFFWGKNRIRDPRPSIGVCSEAIHPIDLARLLFGCDRLDIDGAFGIVSDMQTGHAPVMDGIAMMFGDHGRPIIGQSSFAWPHRDRRLVAFAGDGTDIYRLCLQFDNPRWDCDRLTIVRLDPENGTTETVFETSTSNSDFPEQIHQVYKVYAFVRESIKAARGTAPSVPLVGIDTAIALQTLLDQIQTLALRRPAQLTDRKQPL